jgi:predicted kinase
VADEVIMINGLPGAGKTTVGASLASAMSAQFLSKDVLKEHLAKEHERPPSSRLGIVASELMWSKASAQSGVVIVESWWYRTRDVQFAADGLCRSGADRAVEVWCTASVDTVRERYRRRSRSALHRDLERLATDWEDWARNAEPLNLVPVITVDTATPVDIPALITAVRAVLPTSSLLRSRVIRASNQSD